VKHPIIALDARCIGTRKTGDSTYWKGLVHGLFQINSELRFLLFSNTARPTGIPESERLRWIELKGRSSRWWSLATFPLAARQMGASVLHTQYNVSPLAVNPVTTIHDVSFFAGPQWFKPRDRYLLRTLVPRSARRAKQIITVSHFSKSEIERFIPGTGEKVRVTPLALNADISPMERGKARTLVEKDFSLSGPYLLTVGTQWPRKNMRLAVESADLLPESLSHRLVLTGHPGWGEGSHGGRLLTVGYVSELQLAALYGAADLYLVPSRYEGFGLTLLEAFACGCPVLSSAGGSLPEVAGDAAAIESTWDSSHWANTISELLGDSSKLRALREKGLSRVQSFSWEETARLTEQVYRDAIDD
jgi:glycosyltransferase involved in cell wall biosynthesis